MVLVVVNCFSKFTERRILIASLVLNFLSLLAFADYSLFMTSPSHIATQLIQLDSSKYLFGFALITLTNLLIESSAVTFLMKHLAHYVPANSYLMNSGFLLEFIELMAKITTILVLMFGIYLLNIQYLHNFLILIFVVMCIVMGVTTIVGYGSLRIRIK